MDDNKYRRLQEQYTELSIHHMMHHDREEQLREQIIRVESDLAYAQGAIADLQTELNYYREAGVALAHELEEAA